LNTKHTTQIPKHIFIAPFVIMQLERRLSHSCLLFYAHVCYTTVVCKVWQKAQLNNNKPTYVT